jgi:site-specific DNA-methyltransferase (adenine-specific)
MEAMRQTPDKFYDLAVVDPPYGIGAAKEKPHNGWKDYGVKHWDNSIPTSEYFTELLRITKNQIIWGGNYFTDFLPASMCWICWDKGQREFSLADGELAWCSFNKAMRIFTLARAAMLNEERIHATQKPIKLYMWLLSKFAKTGDKILDTHLGSGSSRIAAYDLGFDFTGYELDKDYFDAQEKRFANHVILHGNDMFKPEITTQKQQSLF